MRKVDLTEIIDKYEFFIDDDSKEIVIKTNDAYKTSIELGNDYSISVDGNMLLNYNGKIFIGSMANDESLGMSINEIQEECERRYMEEMEKFNSNSYELTDNFHEAEGISQCATCKV